MVERKQAQDEPFGRRCNATIGGHFDRVAAVGVRGKFYGGYVGPLIRITQTLSGGFAFAFGLAKANAQCGFARFDGLVDLRQERVGVREAALGLVRGQRRRRQTPLQAPIYVGLLA